MRQNGIDMQETLSFYINLASLVVKVNSRYEKSRDFCAEYLTENDAADIVSEVSDEDIDREIESNMSLSREYCENVCLYRAIAEQLPSFSRMVFHGAAVSACGRGYIFTAPSGTGKSTHIELLERYFGENVRIINGDKPIIGVSSDSVTVYSTPWAGKEGWQSKTEAPLAGIIILRRGKENKIRRVSPSEYFSELMTQVYIPKNGDMTLKTLELFDALAKKVDFYLLECDISKEAAETSFKIMSE